MGGVGWGHQAGGACHEGKAWGVVCVLGGPQAPRMAPQAPTGTNQQAHRVLNTVESKRSQKGGEPVAAPTGTSNAHMKRVKRRGSRAGQSTRPAACAGGRKVRHVSGWLLCAAAVGAAGGLKAPPLAAGTATQHQARPSTQRVEQPNESSLARTADVVLGQAGKK